MNKRLFFGSLIRGNSKYFFFFFFFFFCDFLAVWHEEKIFLKIVSFALDAPKTIIYLAKEN